LPHPRPAKPLLLFKLNYPHHYGQTVGDKTSLQRLVSPLPTAGNGEAFLGKGGAFRRPWGFSPVVAAQPLDVGYPQPTALKAFL